MRRLTIPSIAVAAAAIAFAGCGSSDNSSGSGSSGSGASTGGSASSGGGGYGSASASSSGGGSAATVSVAKAGDLGKALVDAKGVSLYLFKKDTGPKSTCFGKCASVWAPLTTQGKPKAGSGARAGKLGTTKRKDGKTQVTYNGHPLYYYAGDRGKPGSTKGEDVDQFGAEWYLVSPKGEEVEES